MSAGDIVQVTITAQTTQVTRAGFGTPLILSNHSKFTDLVREYTDLAGLVSDGFASTSPEYKAANAIFAQSPRPPKVKIGRRGTPSTMKYTLTPVAKDDTDYRVTIDGVDYVFTSGTSATASDIVTGLIALINVSATDGIVTASGSTTLVLTADAAGVWFDLEADASLFAIACDNAATDIADDLAAINLADADWYAIVSTSKSAAEIAAIAAWAESAKRLFIAASSDTGIFGGGTGDVASTLKTSAYDYSAVIYHPTPGAFADAAWLGRCLPLTPGSETWKFKTLAGVPAVSLTPSQRANITGKNAAVYTTVSGVNMTQEGVTASGEFIDNRRFLDWCAARVAEDVFALLANADKVPYTDPGAVGVGSVIKAVLDEGVVNGGFAADPAPTVTVPRVASQSTGDRAARRLGGIKFTATLAGAVHSVNVQGVVSI